MSDRILVLGANRYNFESDGRMVRGVTLHYLETYDVADANKRGLLPLKTSTTDEVFESLTQAPCYADADFGRRPGKAGKAETYIRGVKILGPLSLQTGATK